MMPPTPCPWRAHPHSRGENPSRSDWLVGGTGSSPLTRGKQVEARAQARDHGLIPTHAGKTLDVKIAAFRLRAHPHSRGENSPSSPRPSAGRGSSPLTRGKPSARAISPGTNGLIPTHAGKTTRCSSTWNSRRAHPHSRGENMTSSRCIQPGLGSSPLTRGKRA